MSRVAETCTVPVPYVTTTGYLPIVVLLPITQVSGVVPLFVQEIDPANGVDESVQVD